MSTLVLIFRKYINTKNCKRKKSIGPADLASSAKFAKFENPGSKFQALTSEPPTTEAPTSEAPTTEPPLNCGDELIIDNDDDCMLLFVSNWTSIDVKSGMCNDINWNLIISDSLCLERLMIGDNSLKDVESLTISNNPRLNQIVIKDGRDWRNGALNKVKSVVIDSMICIV